MASSSESSMPSPTTLLTQLECFNAQAISFIDPILRKQLQRAATTLSYRLEDPATAAFRLTVGQAAEASALKVAFNIGLLPLLAKDPDGTSIRELANSTATDPILLLRVLRFLTAFGVVVEHGDQRYSLGPTCETFGNPAFANAACGLLNFVRPMMDAVSEVIEGNGRQNLYDRLNGAAQKALNAPGKELWAVLLGMGPEVIQSFSTFMSAASKNSAKMHQVYPVQERLVQAFEHLEDEVFWLDVGGGNGQYTIDLLKTFPDLPGRFVVQDMDPVIAQAKHQGLGTKIEFQGHDFFATQTIQGARTYYFRQCFHNWQDEECKFILQRTAAAMRPGYSRLLIHEIVMPETGAGVWEVMMDWLMMAAYSALERSEQQWTALVHSAGLQISKIYSNPSSAESVIEILRV